MKKTAVNDILLLDSGKIYVATYEGLYIVKNMKIERVLKKEDGLPDNMVNVVFKDSRGFIWCASYVAKGGGACCIKNESVQQSFNNRNGLIHNAITSIAETIDGDILIGGGVYNSGGASRLIFNENKWVIDNNIVKSDGLAGDKVRYIYVNDRGHVWFCSEYDGIAVMNSKYELVKVITAKEGLSDNEIKKIAEDKYGNIWLASRRGVTRVSNYYLKQISND